MVFFMEYCWRIFAMDSGFSSTRLRRRSRPSWSSGSRERSFWSASGSAVSMMVPLGSTNTMESRVLYVLYLVPEDMPEELFATTPPMVQADQDAGSGPSL